MSSIDLGGLLSPVSDAEPAGPNLEDEPSFAELLNSAKGKPEQQFGDTVIPGEEPDWRQVKRLALELLGRTRDLRVGVTLTRALAHTDGFEGLADGLTLNRQWLDTMWDSVHPQLDPVDPDPLQRVNTLAALDDFTANVRAVRESVLVAAPRVGRFSYRDVLVATNKLPAPPTDGEIPSLAVIESAFRSASIADVEKTAADLRRAEESIVGIEKAFVSRVGAANGVSLGTLQGLLKGARQIVSEQHSRNSAQAEQSEEIQSATTGAVRGASGAISTRDDVVQTLDRLCDYFERNEPSSPVPILLRRAKRLINKSFMDLVRDMAPDGVSQVELLRGSEE